MTAYIDAINRVYRQVLLAVGLGRVTFSATGAGPTEKYQVQLGSTEVHDNERRFFEYGFASRLFPGCSTISVYIAGDRGNGVIVASNDGRYRIDLQPGESAQYDDQGQFIKISRTGIVIQGNNLPITIETSGAVNVNAGGNANINATGNVVIATGGTVQLGAAGGKKLALDGDPVVGGVIQASSTKGTCT
jgi:phage gp45-like